MEVATELNLMIDHVSLSVEDLERAKYFYSKALAPLGLEVVGEVTAEQSGSVAFVGFGIGRKGSFWVAHNGRQTPTTHICFRAPTRAAVRAFHAAALAPAPRTTAVQAFGPSTTTPITPRACSVPRDTTSRQSVSKTSAERLTAPRAPWRQRPLS